MAVSPHSNIVKLVSPYLAQLQTPGNTRVTAQFMEFVALRAVGWSCQRAYIAIRPNVKETSAHTLGIRMNRIAASAIAEVKGNVDLVQRVLAESAVIDVLQKAEATDSDKLTAAKLVLQKQGALSGDSVSIHLSTRAESLAEPSSEPVDVEFHATDGPSDVDQAPLPLVVEPAEKGGPT